MTNKELNALLQSAKLPEPPAPYWTNFTKRVLSKIAHDAASPGEKWERRAEVPRAKNPALPLWLFGLKPGPALAFGALVLLVAASFWFGVWHGKRQAFSEPSLAELTKYYHEIQALFPNQLQAIVFESSGPRLVLADKGNVAASPPLYLKICGPSGCKGILTFSGQQIQINGDRCDVLVDHSGTVIIAGQQFLWSSAQTSGKNGAYRIEAKAIESKS